MTTMKSNSTYINNINSFYLYVWNSEWRNDAWTKKYGYIIDYVCKNITEKLI